MVDRLMDEGLLKLPSAMAGGGLSAVSVSTGIRMCLSRDLEAIKVRGRWMTSVAAVRRYLIRRAKESDRPPHRSRGREGSRCSVEYLRSIGLGPKEQGQ